MEMLILAGVILLVFLTPSRNEVFRISRVGCRYINWMPRYGAVGKLNLTCQLASAPLDAEERIGCTVGNCPIVNEHMKGRLKYHSEDCNEMTPVLIEDKKPHKSDATGMYPLAPPPPPREG